MRRPVAVRAALAALLLATATAVAAGGGAYAQEGDSGSATDVTVSLSESEISAFSGDRFTITSEIKNNDSQATPPLIANLAFVAIDGETYVDPEDWSPQRTLVVASIRGRSSLNITWTIKPALEGDVAVYVAVLPQDPELSTSAPLAVSPALHLTVSERRSLNPGGVLPVVLIVPGALMAAFAGVRVIRRRR